MVTQPSMVTHVATYHNTSESVDTLPVLSMNEVRPPSYDAATESQEMSPNRAPPTAPEIIPIELALPQNIARVIGKTAEPINTPMNRYTQPRLT